jgi:hypothetical protein
MMAVSNQGKGCICSEKMIEPSGARALSIGDNRKAAKSLVHIRVTTGY